MEGTSLDYAALLKSRVMEMESATEMFRPTNFWTSGVAGLAARVEAGELGQFKRWPEASFWFYPKFAYGRFARLAERRLAGFEPGREEKAFRKWPERWTGRLAGVRDYDVLRIGWNHDIWPIRSTS